MHKGDEIKVCGDWKPPKEHQDMGMDSMQIIRNIHKNKYILYSTK